MASNDTLQTLLHTQLYSDASSVKGLPQVLSLLSEHAFESSAHIGKWSNRINSLMHSKEPATRWAGLTLALRCSMLSRTFMMSSAQTWVTVTLPMLSKNENLALYIVGIKLIAYIFSKTIGLAEFQRQVAIPNVPKFSSALMSLAQKQSNEELKILCLETLSLMVPLYPNIHRPLSSSLSTLSLNLLNGSSTRTPYRIVNSASRLQACLHTTGGKVGGTALWRDGVDDTIGFCVSALEALRTSYRANAHDANNIPEPIYHVLHNLDRLYCGTELLCHYLRVSVSRPVSVPVKALVTLCLSMLKVTESSSSQLGFDSSLRMAEASAVGRIHELGCSLTVCVSKCLKYKLTPYLNRLLSVIVFHLERRYPSTGQLPFVRLIPTLLGSCATPSDPLVIGRIVKSILPALSCLLADKSANDEVVISSDVTGGKKGKKRSKTYEGGEVLKAERDVLCESVSEGELALGVLDALPLLLRTPDLPSHLHSLSSRLLISLLLAIPRHPASSVASDLSLKGKILHHVETACVNLCSESSSVLSSTLPFILEALKNSDALYSSMGDDRNHRQQTVELMLHPRLPPLFRSFPSLDSIALSQDEEGQEERETRANLGLRVAGGRLEMERNHDIPIAPASVPAVSAPSVQSSIQGTLKDVPFIEATSIQTIRHHIPPAVTTPTLQAPNKEIAKKPSFPANGHPELGEPRVEIYPSATDPTLQMEPLPEPRVDATLSMAPVQSSTAVASDAMVVNDDDDENVEVPPINMESDTESEGE